jgi:hypothetical protein
MRKSLLLTLLLGVSLSAFLIVIFFIIFLRRKESSSTESDQYDVESLDHNKQGFSSETEELVIFQGGEDLTICDILDAPGEVIGKSSYGTLYKASLQRSGKIRVLRFLRPVCTVRSDSKEFNGIIETLGFVRHENLVPLLGFYAGNRGEKLMVHPFFGSGNLSDFIRSKSLCFLFYFLDKKVLKRTKLFLFSDRKQRMLTFFLFFLLTPWNLVVTSFMGFPGKILYIHI